MTTFSHSARTGLVVVVLRMTAAVLIMAAPAAAAAIEGAAALKQAAEGETPWQISAKKILYNHNTGVYTATGDVRIVKDGKTLTGDLIQYNQATMDSLAIGNVRLMAGGDTLRGDEIQLNLATGNGVIRHGTVFIEKNHFFIQGDEIRKTGENAYELKNASLTSCDGDRPAWRITGQDLDVTIEKYGWLKNAAFRVKDWPVLYVPYLVFPVKIKRQTGLLTPQVGFSSRNGFEITQPLYWAVSQDADATFYYHHIHERGEKFGGEYRYTLSRRDQGTLMLDWLDDRQSDDGTGDWGYPDDPWVRTNTDRYWFRSKIDQSLPGAVKATLDLDVVSDQDYLHEFSDGYTGFEESRKYFNRRFGRDLDDENDPVRENALSFSRTWTQYSLNAGMRWYDDVVKRRQESVDPTLQQLPGVTFDALRQPVLNNRFLVGMDAGYTHFYRQDGDTGQRVDVHPRLYMPLHFRNYASFEPSVGFRQTAWFTDLEALDATDAGADPAYNDYRHREIYDLAADLSTDLFQVFQVQSKNVEKIKHTITPKLAYSYIPDTDQSDFPVFTEEDRIDPENRMTFSLTQFLISKSHVSTPASATGPVHLPGAAADPYHQFLRFLLSQSYDFQPPDASADDPFAPLYGELDIEPAGFLTLHGDAEWCHDLGKFVSNNVNTRLNNARGDYLMVEHRYSRDRIQSVSLGGFGGLTRRISVFGNYERNIETGKSIETLVGCRYQAQCWSLALSYKNEINDRKIGFMIGLAGLAEMGSDF